MLLTCGAPRALPLTRHAGTWHAQRFLGRRFTCRLDDVQRLSTTPVLDTQRLSYSPPVPVHRVDEQRLLVLNTSPSPSLDLFWPGLAFQEWGNPNESKYHDYMLSYSPYDNVRRQPYPAMLVTGGLNDPRVRRRLLLLLLFVIALVLLLSYFRVVVVSRCVFVFEH